jgi:hypothetical protein
MSFPVELLRKLDSIVSGIIFTYSGKDFIETFNSFLLTKNGCEINFQLQEVVFTFYLDSYEEKWREIIQIFKEKVKVVLEEKLLGLRVVDLRKYARKRKIPKCNNIKKETIIFELLK